MNNAVIYARYSSAGQTEQSIEGQLRVCYEYAERQGYAVVNEYIDRAMTGTNAERPDFQQMIEDAAKKQFEYIIVYKLDRFARNHYDSVFYKHKLQQHGVRVLSATEAISDTQEGKLVEGILEMVAEMYSHDLSQKVKRGLRESVIKGTFTGGHILFGYKVEDKRVVIDEDSAKVVRFIFEGYAAGKTKKQLVEELNAKGWTNYHGKAFTINSFQNSLSNRKYIGENLFNGVESPDSYPAIISKDLFERVQAKLNERKRAPATTKAKEEYLLYGKLFCGPCGSKMVGVSGTSKTGNRHSYYVCAKRYKENACRKQYEKKGFLEWYVVQQTIEYVLDPRRASDIADLVVAEFDRSITGKRIKEYERQLDRIEKELDRCFNLMMKAESDDAIKRADTKSKDLGIQRDDLTVELRKLRLASAMRHTKEDIISWLKIFTRGEELDPAFQRRIIDTLVNSIYLFDDKIVIYFNVIKGGKLISHIEMLEHLEDIGELSIVTDTDGGVLISSASPRQTGTYTY